MDTLTQARRVARVVGVDSSPVAIGKVRDLAQAIGVEDAEFIESDIYDLERTLDRRFDVVFTSIGVLGWLPDLEPWVRLIAQLHGPGGRFVILEGHPLAAMFDDEAAETELRIRYPYFPQRRPLCLSNTGVYSEPDSSLESTTYEWPHSMSDVVGALLRAGLEIRSLRAFPFAAWPMFRWMERQDDGTWRLPRGVAEIPLMFSLEATRHAG